MYLQIQLIKLYYEHDDVSTSLSLSSVQDRAPLDAQELMDAEKTLMMMLCQQRRGGGEVGGDEEEDASTPSSEGEENLDLARGKYNVFIIYLELSL